MGLKECVIMLDNQWSTYYPGQTINGCVNYTFDTPKKVRGVHIQFRGAAATLWSENVTRKNADGQNSQVTVNHTADEEYFSISYYLVGSKAGNEIELPAGTHSYPFTCALPPTLPSSFEGEFGHVRYTIKTTLDRPWKFDHETKMAFTVVSHMDLNTIPKCREPIRIHMEKTFCCCWCKSGPLTIDVGLPVAGFCPGQTMPIDVICENGSSVDVDDIIIKLLKIVKFRCHKPSSESKTTTITIAEVVMDSVVGNSTKNMCKVLEIPPLPPSNLLNCSIIDLDYELTINCSVSGPHMDLDDSYPITIGTVPIVGYNPPPPTGETITSLPDVPPGGQVAADSPLLPVSGGQFPQNPGFPYPSQPQYPPSGGDPSNQTAQGPYPPPAGYPYSMPPSAPMPGDNGPSAPHQIYPTLAQPVFREGQFAARSIHDANDNQHTQMMGGMTFAPRYPTYGFVAPQ